MLKNLSILLENAKHVQKLLNEIENSFCHSLALFFYGKYIYIIYSESIDKRFSISIYFIKIYKDGKQWFATLYITKYL